MQEIQKLIQGSWHQFPALEILMDRYYHYLLDDTATMVSNKYLTIGKQRCSYHFFFFYYDTIIVVSTDKEWQ